MCQGVHAGSSREALGQRVHQFGVDDDGIVVNNIQFGNILLVLVFEHERVGADDGKILNKSLFMLNALAQLFGNLVVEVVVLVVYPLLHDNSGYLLVIVIECHKFACLLVYTDVDICENGSFLG